MVVGGPEGSRGAHAARFRDRLVCRSVPLSSVRHCSKGAQSAKVEECAAARAVRARCAGAESACAQARTRDAGIRRPRVSAWLGSRCVRPACRAHLVCPRASRQVRGRVAVVVGLAGAVDRPGARDLKNAPGGLRRPVLRRGRPAGRAQRRRASLYYRENFFGWRPLVRPEGNVRARRTQRVGVHRWAAMTHVAMTP